MSAAENNSSAFRTNPTAHSPPNSPSTSRSLNLPEPPSPIQPTSSNSLADADSGEAPLSYALTRPPKKLRPPVSIFDLPCPPTAAPPQDNDEFSSHLDALEKMLEEEDTGAIPTGLEIGPQILVESLNKKRVRSLVTQGQTDLSSSLSSEGSGPIANDLTQDTDQILFVDTAPPSSILPAHKKVHFAPGLDNEQENKAEPILVVIADGDAIDTTDDKEAGLKRDRDVDQKVEQAPKPNKEPRLSPPQSASSNEPSNSSASAAVGRNKKGKEPVRSVASMIGSRRKPVAAHSSAASRSSVPTARTPGSTSRTSAAQRTAPSVITLDEDERVGPDRTDEKAIPEASSAPPIPKSTGETKPTSSPLSSLKLYVIPTQMDKVVFSTMCERVLQLRGEWLGPKTKVLATDPRVKPDIPALDQENTTHIVTALSNIEAVKRFLNVSEINPAIAIVNREWLSDTIMYKRPMEPKPYVLSRPEIPMHVSSPQQDTPPPSQTNLNQIRRRTSITIDGLSVDSKHQLNFQEIMQGIQEGSLGDDEFSESDDNDDGHSDSDVEAEEAGAEEAEAADETARATGGAKSDRKDDVSQEGGLRGTHGLTQQEVQRLKRENRCFRCKEVGHWVDRCPQRTPGSTKDEVLLQIISSGVPEGKRRRKYKYQCESPHVTGRKDEPRYNRAIIEQLKILMDHYDNIQTKGSNERFKVINYRKAITAIRALDYEITSEEMALKVPRVGKKIAQKIGECVSLGRIKKLDHLNWDNERQQVETLFKSVYGVGSEKTTEWYNKGLRTLDDLRKLPDLTKNQISGLKYYDDLLKRIPRSEVAQIGKVVESAAKQLHLDIESRVTGSYRRGKPDCGDIDIVIARPNVDNGDELFAIMNHLMRELINQGFLVDHLSLPTWSDDMANRPKHFKYMGICKLPGPDAVHHHIDILIVPWIHLGAVLLYFTGNDICNRSMRLLAANRGMRLSDKGLFEGVIRGKNRKRVNEGRWVAGRTEREIFEYLKIDYLEPYEREC